MMKKLNRKISLILSMLMLFMVLVPSMSMAVDTVTAGTTENFAILAGSTITNTGATTVVGDIGLHPGTVFTGQADVTVTGSVYLADAVAQQAKDDLITAYNSASGGTAATIPTELGGQTLTPGVYKSASGTFEITGTLTLDGQGDLEGEFIFQTASTLTTATDSIVLLEDSAQACNVFWVVGSSATLGVDSDFTGSLMAMESITANNGASVTGQLLARNGAVTLDKNTITKEGCVQPSATEGSLKVTKVVQGPIGTMTLPVFELTVTGPGGFTETRTFAHNESYTWNNLVPGTYTVTESRTGLDSQWTVSGEGDVQVAAGQTALTTINNLYSIPVITTGSLTVDKVVAGDISGLTLPLFNISVNGPGGFTATRTFLHNEAFTWNNLVPGAYTVTESRTGLNSQWVVSGEGAVQVAANQSAVTTINNLYTPPPVIPSDPPIVTTGALTVDKVVAGNIGDLELPLFSITVKGPEGFSSTRTFLHNESFTWSNLVPGVYTVTESRTGLDSQWAVSGEGTVQVTGNDTAVTTINNFYSPPVEPTGSLTVDKIVAGNIGDLELRLFRITVKGPEGFSITRSFVHNESFTWNNLIPGVYTVTESRTGLDSQWAVSGEGTVQVTSNDTAVTTINNFYSPPVEPTGSLTVEKIVSGNIDDLTLPLFRITVTGPESFKATRSFVHNESFTWNNLVSGVYTVTESRTGLSSLWTVSGEGAVQVTANQTALTTITNEYDQVDIPQTGQKTNYNISVFFGMAAILFAGTGGLLANRRKKLNG